MKFLIPSIVITGLFLTSCATSESFVNDDIYSVRPSELPIGESTADETSYASFKSRKQGDANDRMTYSDEMAMRNRQNCLDQYRWYDGCGCSYTEWLRSSRYSPQSNMHNWLYSGRPQFGLSFAYGNFRPYSYYGSFYPYNSFGGYHPYVGYWGYNSMYMYPYHHSPHMWYDPYFGYGMGFGYPSFYGGGMYGYYGYGFGGYGYGGNMNGWSNSGHNSGVSSNVIRGPRGTTTSGHYNPTGRAAANPSQVLMMQNNTSRTAPTSTRSNTVVKEVGNRDVISRTTSPTTNRTTNSERTVTTPSTTRSNVDRGTTYERERSTRPIEGQRVTSPTNSRGNSDYQRSYPSRENNTPNSRGNVGTPGRTNTPSSGGFERSSSPTQSRGTSVGSSPSRGSSGMGSSSSPSGGSRSGGSSGSNSGGRR